MPPEGGPCLPGPTSFRRTGLIATNRLISTPTVELCVRARRAHALEHRARPCPCRPGHRRPGPCHRIRAAGDGDVHGGAARYFGRRADHPVRRLRGVGRRPLPPAVGRLPLARGAARALRALRLRSRGGAQLLSLGRVLARHRDDRAHRDADGDQRCRGADRHLRGQRGDDLLWSGPGTIRATGRLAVAVLARVRRGHRTVARRGRLPSSPGSTAEPPAFVYAIFVSLFVFFNIFALNMWLQYRRVNRWKSYLFGERAYFMLSLSRSRRSPGRCSRGHWPVDLRTIQAISACTRRPIFSASTT